MAVALTALSLIANLLAFGAEWAGRRPAMRRRQRLGVGALAAGVALQLLNLGVAAGAAGPWRAPWLGGPAQLLSLAALLGIVGLLAEPLRSGPRSGMRLLASGLAALLEAGALALGVAEPTAAAPSALLVGEQALWLLGAACLLVAAGAALQLALALRVAPVELGLLLAGGAAPVLLLAGGLQSMLARLAFQAPVVGLAADGRWLLVRVQAPGQESAQRVLLDVPWIGPLLGLAIALYALAAVLGAVELGRRRGARASPPAYWTLFAACTALAATALALVAQTAGGAPLDLPKLDGPLTADLHGPYRFALLGNPEQVSALLLVLLASAAYLAWDQRSASLPAPDGASAVAAGLLDDRLDRVFIAGFAALSAGLVAGAVGSHFAYGRLWAASPAQTWALAVWLLCAIQLHARDGLGRSGKTGALIALGCGALVLLALGSELARG